MVSMLTLAIAKPRILKSSSASLMGRPSSDRPKKALMQLHDYCEEIHPFNFLIRSSLLWLLLKVPFTRSPREKTEAVLKKMNPARRHALMTWLAKFFNQLVKRRKFRSVDTTVLPFRTFPLHQNMVTQSLVPNEDQYTKA